ncbi:unnamed protein product [Aphis gossypii]|uniref:Uncharacterized protein n=2 Tax=Aphis gossypii TaxID=80765 RepID=A0A9P0NT72_APHGO|nr:unnamed protein product [Aphis gossypii]
MKIRTNLYLITAILLTSNLLTLCEGDSDIDHDSFPDNLDDHFDHLDDLHDMVGPILDNDKVIHRVELVEHNGDILTKYATTSHTNQETKNEIFPNTITTIQQSNAPASFTKVIKKTIIKQSNNDGNSSPETDLSMNDMYSTNKLKENGISNSMSKSQTLSQMDHVKNIGLPPLPLQKTSDLQGNIKNIIHTTVTKTTTSAGSPSNELNESFNRKHSLDGLSSNNIISTTSSTKSNFNDGTVISGSLQSNSMEGGSNIKKISMTEDMINGNGINKSQRISRTPVGSIRRTKTTIIKQHSVNDDNDSEDLDKSNMEFNTENISSNNIASSMTNPSGFNTMTTTTIDRDNSNNNAFNQGIPSRREKTRFHKFNGNSVSESGISQNPGSFVQTKTTIIKNGRAADEIKFDDLNGGKIDYGIDSGFSNSNNNINSNYIVSSSNNGNDDDNNFSFNYGYKNGHGSGLQNNYNGNYYGISENKYNGNIMSSDMLGNEYVVEYSNGNGKRKKRKKKGSTIKYQGGRSKNISNGSRKGNGQRKVKNGSNYKSTKSSKSRSGGSPRYYSSNSYVKGQSKSSSSSESASGEISTGKKTSCHCKKGQKLNKRDSNESIQNSYSTDNFGAGSHYLSNSIDNQQMKNNGDFPPFMGREPPPNLMLNNMILRQQPIQLLNDGQSDVTTILNRQGETRSQQIDDHHSAYMTDFKNGQYFKSLGLDIGSNFGPGPDLGKGPGHGHGYGPGPGHGPGAGHGHDSGRGPDPGIGSEPGPGKGASFGPGFGPGKGPGQEANLFGSTSFYNGNFFDRNQRLPLPFPPSQFPYPYSFNKDNYSDFSKMDITTPEFMGIQSGQENQVNINTILPQIQQDSDNEGSGFNQMDAVNSRSITTHTKSNMIKNINSDPIIEYKKITETANNIENNSIPVRHIVQMLSVPPEV